MKTLIRALVALCFLSSSVAYAGVDQIARGLAVKAQTTASGALSGASLSQSGGAVAHTGDVTETTTTTVTVPANALGANGVVRILAFYTLSGTAAGKTVRVKIGGTTVATFGVPSTATFYRVEVAIAEANATNAQVASGVGTGSTNALTVTSGAASVDMTQAQAVTITEQLGNSADTITQVFEQIVLYPHS